MTRSKLSESDKQAMAHGFRRGVPVQALADRFGVSSSTVRRILKGSIAEGEAESNTPELDMPTEVGPTAAQLEIPTTELPTVPQAETITEADQSEVPAIAVANQSLELPTVPQAELVVEVDRPEDPVIPVAHESSMAEATPATEDNRVAGRRSRRRSSMPAPTVSEEAVVPASAGPAAVEGREAPESSVFLEIEPVTPAIPKPILNRKPAPETSDLEELADEFNDLDEDLDEDLDDLDEDLEDDEFDSDDELDIFNSPALPSIDLINILPLSAAAFPRPCYLVIDRSAELITRPLKDFADLGQIPSAEVQETTLPVFDNHRMARRFSNRTQRIIKVPDGNLLQKVGSHLYARGITRLLLNGKVYAMDN